MKTKIILVFLPLVFSLGCENVLTRKFGGKMSVKVPCDQKVINVTWKEDHFWILMKKMNQNDSAETLLFKEKSVYGALEGEVILQESRCE